MNFTPAIDAQLADHVGARWSPTARWAHRADAQVRGVLASVPPSSSRLVPGGLVHELPDDLREALVANLAALDA